MKNLLLLTFSILIGLSAYPQQYGWIDLSDRLPLQGSLHDVMFIGQEGWIAGPNDAIFYTSDGGATFEIQELPEMAGIDGISLSVFMKNTEEGYVTTNSGEINKTEDGGNTWVQLYDLSGFLYKSVHCPPNSDTCYTCGGNGKVWKFTDDYIEDISIGGTLVETLACILFPESNAYGMFCGQTIIRRYFNNTWNNLILYDNSYSYHSIFCLDNENCWASGSQGAIIKTTDGVEWTIRWNGPHNEIMDVYFVDAEEGWAAGEEILLHTTDGGENWIWLTPFDFSEKTLTALWFNSPIEGYMVSNTGNFYKYTEVSGIEEGMQDLAFEVYPNPCRDKFQITNSKIQINSKIQTINVQIIDLFGRVIEVFNMEHGTRNTEHDISHLPAGLYFVRVQADNRIGIQKLIIQ